MKRNNLINNILIGTGVLLSTTLAYAGTPLWTFKPLNATTVHVSANATATVQYQVTNQSRTSHILVMSAIPGVTQVTTAGNCPSPFSLAYQQSCTLTLQVNGSSLSGNVVGGPVVCQQGNPNQCYQPSQENSLNITKSATVPNTTLSIRAPAAIPVNDGSATLTITNTGTYTAYNVSAALPDSWNGVTQDSSNCASIAPTDTCTLTFTSTTAYVAQGGITVSGDNINSPPTTAIAFTTQGYSIWKVSGTTVWVIDMADLPSSEAWGGNGTEIGSGAQSLTAGINNTFAIVARLGAGSYAAEGCVQNTNGGFSNWYLPAICEMGGENQGAGCASGLANIDTNLVQLGFGGLAGNYWSSTESSLAPTLFARYETFASGGGSTQLTASKGIPFGVRCTRSLTL